MVLCAVLSFCFVYSQAASLAKSKINIRTQDVSWAGKYSYGAVVKEEAVGVLEIYPIDESTRSYIFHLEVNRGYPSYNSGELIGKIEITSKGEGVFKVKDDQIGINCTLTFDFHENTAIIKTDKEACYCGFGNAVTADGEYKKKNPKIPDFFIDRHGNKIYFKNLIDQL